MNRQQRRAAGRKGEGPNIAAQPEDPAFIEAMQLHQAGRLAEAAQLCRQVIARNPRHADALHVIGVFSLQNGQPQIASDLIGRAIAVNDRSAQFHNNLGSALRALGRADEAVASFRRAIALKPDYVRALINLGRTLDPARRGAEAIDSLRRALTLAPLDLEACWTLGTLLQGQGALDEAAACYERALRIAPGSADIVDNLARVRFAQGRTDDGIAALRRVLELKPTSSDHWCVLATALQSQVRLSEAADAYHQAISHNPEFAPAHNALAGALADTGRLEESIACYRQAIRLQPDYPEAHSNLIMTLHSLPGVSAGDVLAEARRYAAVLEPRSARQFHNAPDPERPLRIGYVSADFRDHPVGYFLDRVLAAHDAQTVQTLLYSDTQFPDEQTARLRAAASEWRPICGIADTEVAAMIGADEVDILVDLAGHTGSNRLPLFATRAAPVQVSWLGYFGTTGLTAMDYILADEVVLPAGEEALFSERPVRLPSPYLCWSPPELDLPVAPFPALRQGFVTFGCFNNRRKITGDTVDAWARILGQVDGSRLFLKSWSLADAGCRTRLTEAFAARGVDGQRLMFEGLTPRADALAAYNRVDIALDPFPFGGCTTTADTLWMGVPLVTLAGGRWSGRMSQMILSCLGLHDWIAADTDAYVETAVRMAGQLSGPARGELRAHLEGSAFCDGPAFTRHLEAAYRGMWRNWCAAQA